MDIGEQNERWAHQIIDLLIHQGIEYFCYAPGSRCASLAVALAARPHVRVQTHYDERGLCFHALGYGKAKKKPAVFITTSGTAVGNLLPAIMEANNARIPLLILSADRPPELRACGANQTIDQVKLFQNDIRWQVDLPCPDEKLPKGYLPSLISHAIAMTTYPIPGPVHINAMFREPLYAAELISVHAPKPVHFESPLLIPAEKTIERWTQILSQKKQGVLILGSSSVDLSEAAISLAERLQWPIFPDILSSLRTGKQHPLLISHFDPILKLKSKMHTEAVIQLGDRIVSKTLSLWLEKQSPAFYLHISDHPIRQDPFHLITDRIISSVDLFVQKILSGLPPQNQEQWCQQWFEWNQNCHGKYEEIFSEATTLTEPGLIWELASHLSDEWSLFLGNGMPVRDANQLFAPPHFVAPLFGNRGVSGIDGNIATAAGIAEARGKPVVAVIGDQAFLHDLNSLPLIKKSRAPVVLVAVNNDGSGIFSFLPIAKRKDAWEEFFAAAHGYTFSSAAALFDIPYFHPQTPDELRAFLSGQEKNPHSCIVEITTDRLENIDFHQFLITEISQCLSSPSSSVEIPANLH